MRHDQLACCDYGRHNEMIPAIASWRSDGRLRISGSTSSPASALAAATRGPHRYVSPLPCLPAKLRLLVRQLHLALAGDADLARGAAAAAAVADQPAGLHEHPTSPSSSACIQTCRVAGTTRSITPSFTRWPRRISAALRRSSMRPLVQEPMNTLSIGTRPLGDHVAHGLHVVGLARQRDHRRQAAQVDRRSRASRSRRRRLRGGIGAGGMSSADRAHLRAHAGQRDAAGQVPPARPTARRPPPPRRAGRSRRAGPRRTASRPWPRLAATACQSRLSLTLARHLEPGLAVGEGEGDV